jgi:protein kinase C substrate 80K-H
LGVFVVESSEFSGWEGEDYRVMKYTNGQQCWGGPDRSTTVKLTCGASNEIKSIEEPSKCEYLMVLVTPYACSAAEAKDLEQQLADNAPIDGTDIQ